MKRKQQDLHHPPSKRSKLNFVVLFPEDCLLQVLEFLPPVDHIYTIPYVCKSWTIVQKQYEDLIWRTMCLREWSILRVLDTSAWNNWKEFFRQFAICVPPVTIQVKPKENLAQICVHLDTSPHLFNDTSQLINDLEKTVKRLKMQEEYRMKIDSCNAESKDRLKDEPLELEFQYIQDLGTINGFIFDSGKMRFKGLNGKSCSLSHSEETEWTLKTDEGYEGMLADECGFWCLPVLDRMHKHLGLKHFDIEALSEYLAEYDINLEEISLEDIQAYNDLKKGKFSRNPFSNLIDISDQNSYNIGKRYLLQNPEEIENAPEKYMRDKSFVLEILKIAPNVLQYVDRRLLSDPEIARNAPISFAREYFQDHLEQDADLQIHEIEMILEQPELIQKAPDYLRDNYDLIMALVTSCEDNYITILQFASDRLKSDEQIVIAALTANPSCWCDVSEQLLVENKNVRKLLTTIEAPQIPLLLSKIPQLMSNRKLIYSFVRRDPSIFATLPTEMKEDIGIIIAAFRIDPTILRHVQRSIYAENDIIQGELLQLLQTNYELLEYAREAHQSNRELILRLSEMNPCALKYASAELRDDPTLFLQLVQSYKSTVYIQYASDRLLSDNAFAISIIQSTPDYSYSNFKASTCECLCLFSEACLSSPDVVEQLKQRKHILAIVISQVTDVNVVLSLLENNARLYSKLNSKLKEDRRVVLKAIENEKLSSYGLASQWKSGSPWFDDEEIMLQLVQVDLYAAKRLSKRLISSRDFILKVLQVCETAKVAEIIYENISKTLQEDKEIIVAAGRCHAALSLPNISRDIAYEFVRAGGAFSSIPKTYLHDRELSLLAVKSCGENLKHLSIQFRQDREIVTEALRNYPMSIEFASNELRSDPEIMKLALVDGKAATFIPGFSELSKEFLQPIFQVCKKNIGYIRSNMNQEFRRDFRGYSYHL